MTAATATRPAITDPWIDRLIADGRVPDRARALDRADVARRYNQIRDLSAADDSYLYTPGQAQAAVRDLLALVDIAVAPQAAIVLTDGRSGPWCATHRLNPGQVAYAAEQHRQVTGETISAHALLEALPWV